MIARMRSFCIDQHGFSFEPVKTHETVRFKSAGVYFAGSLEAVHVPARNYF